MAEQAIRDRRLFLASAATLLLLAAASARAAEPSSSVAAPLVEQATAVGLPSDELRQLWRALPEDAVAVQIFDGVKDRDWDQPLGDPAAEYRQSHLGFVGLPKKYSDGGLIADRSNPHWLRARSRWNVPAGKYELVLRSLGAARLLVDGHLVAETDFLNRNSSGHEDVPELAAPKYPEMRPLAAGHQERTVQVELEGEQHVVQLDVMVGGKGLRPEVGELSVSFAEPGSMVQLLSPRASDDVALTDAAWQQWADASRQHLAQLDAQTRRRQMESDAEYWAMRRAIGRAFWDERRPAVPDNPAGMPAHNAIDHFINVALAARGLQPAPLSDDHAFLRRATLDVLGLVPTRTEVAEFVKDDRKDRRARMINSLLEQPGWADHWVGYWQDVLAENPGILKPEQNNTGPFRWWIYESLLDRKPMDRFVTELVMMEGSRYYGGPAGFAMATQNDVPMAAKAHVLGTAFLAMDMNCARCHDAPYHPYLQSELFSFAAMLQREAIKLPASSTVPEALADGRQPLVTSSLKPGDQINPAWPFAHVAPQELPTGVLLDESDSRMRVAAILTSPTSERFPRVMVNRLWKRYLGRGLVEPADDWEGRDAVSPELLDYLAAEFVSHGYDLQHVARLILNSHTYQREVLGDAGEEQRSYFATPTRRRLTAEQVVDSFFFVAGKKMNAEPLTLDPEGRKNVEAFLNLGVPQRGWHFTSLSNERDRPALALPIAQSVIDTLLAFGWRDARPNPLTERDETATMVQPLVLGNGLVGHRVTQLSDDSAFTQLALEEVSCEDLVEQLFLQILTRPPADEERAQMCAILMPGYDQRIVARATADVPRAARRHAVSWSNHLNAEATKIKMELERAARAGDPPSGRLDSDWRERMEDVVWALVNSPEFVFVP